MSFIIHLNHQLVFAGFFSMVSLFTEIFRSTRYAWKMSANSTIQFVPSDASAPKYRSLKRTSWIVLILLLRRSLYRTPGILDRFTSTGLTYSTRNCSICKIPRFGSIRNYNTSSNNSGWMDWHFRLPIVIVLLSKEARSHLKCETWGELLDLVPAHSMIRWIDINIWNNKTNSSITISC